MTPDEIRILKGLRKHFGKIVPDDLTMHKVLRLDSGQFYYLAFFRVMGARKTTLVVIDGNSFQFTHLAEADIMPNITKPKAVVHAEGQGGSSQLVWRPCPISYSPLYPFWEVELNNGKYYVDTSNKIYDAIPESNKG